MLNSYWNNSVIQAFENAIVYGGGIVSSLMSCCRHIANLFYFGNVDIYPASSDIDCNINWQSLSIISVDFRDV
jgi:hypothetical protein